MTKTYTKWILKCANTSNANFKEKRRGITIIVLYLVAATTYAEDSNYVEDREC